MVNTQSPPSLMDYLRGDWLSMVTHPVRKGGITFDLMIGRLHGTRPRGRPRTTWLKDLATQANISYKGAITIPRDRKKWRSVGNPRRTQDERESAVYIYTIILLKSVAVRKLQVAILARSSREMYILSRIRVSVRPSNFVYAKNTQRLSRRPSLAQVSVECATHSRLITSNNISGDNSDHSGERLNQNCEKQQVKTSTTRVYTFTT